MFVYALMHRFPNGQTYFGNLATFAVKFLKCVSPLTLCIIGLASKNSPEKNKLIQTNVSPILLFAYPLMYKVPKW